MLLNHPQQSRLSSLPSRIQTSNQQKQPLTAFSMRN
jgi:hypothetical protein